MEQETIAAVLAIGAAFFIAVSDVIHQRSARQVGQGEIGPATLFGLLLADPRWWIGTVSGALGFVLQAAALGLGSVLMVTSLMVTSLLFALPLGARQSGQRLSRSVWVWSMLLAVSATVINTVGHPTEGQDRASLHTWAVVVLVLGPVMLACLAAARAVPGTAAAAVLLAVVSAILWGAFAVLTKGMDELIGHGIRALLTAPEFYGWAAAALAGTVIQQASFRAGALTASLPTMTVVEPVVAATLGVVLLGEVLQPGREGVVILVLAVAVLIVAVAVLSRSEAAVTAEPASSSA